MKNALRAGLVLATTAVSAALLTAPAYAHAAPFTVTAGSAPTGATIAVTKTSGTIAFKDTTSNQNLTCTSSVITGTLKTGSTNGAPVVGLNGTAVKFNNCTGPAGLKFQITGYGTWNINIADSTNGISTGTVTNVRAHVQTTSGPACKFDVGTNGGSFVSSGTATVTPATIAGKYTNSTQGVSIAATNPGRLGAWNVKGTGTNTYCVAPSILKQGDGISFSATWKLTADNAAYNPITIS